MNEYKFSNNLREYWKTNYSAIFNYVYITCYGFFPNQAEDLAAEVIVKLLNLDYDKLTQLERPQAYWIRAAKNHCITYSKKRKELLVPEHEEANGKPLPAYFNISKTELSIDLQNFMENFPISQSAVMRLRLQGFSIKEIAIKQGVTPAAVRGRLERARKKLRPLFYQ